MTLCAWALCVKIIYVFGELKWDWLFITISCPYRPEVSNIRPVGCIWSPSCIYETHSAQAESKLCLYFVQEVSSSHHCEGNLLIGNVVLLPVMMSAWAYRQPVYHLAKIAASLLAFKSVEWGGQVYKHCLLNAETDWVHVSSYWLAGIWGFCCSRERCGKNRATPQCCVCTSCTALISSFGKNENTLKSVWLSGGISIRMKVGTTL